MSGSTVRRSEGRYLEGRVIDPNPGTSFRWKVGTAPGQVRLCSLQQATLQ